MKCRRFKDRRDSGIELAKFLKEYTDAPETLVLGLPRGGVVTAFEVAMRLNLPLDVFVVRKLGVPFQEELAMGAIASGGRRIINHRVVQALGITEAQIEKTAAAEERELERREKAYRGVGRPPVIGGRNIIVVDDGLATGSTMKAAVAAIREGGPREIVVAVPVGASETCLQLEKAADRVLCLLSPDPFDAVGLWYEDFTQTSDEEVSALLSAAKERFYTDGMLLEGPYGNGGKDAAGKPA